MGGGDIATVVRVAVVRSFALCPPSSLSFIATKFVRGGS